MPDGQDITMEAGYQPFEAELLARLPGERLAVGANNPFLADRRDRAWLILRGRLDVSVVPMQDGQAVGVGRHLLSLSGGAVLFGMDPVPLDPADPTGPCIGLRATAPMDSELFEADRAPLEHDDFDLIVVDWVDHWVERLSAALASPRAMPPHLQIEADPDQPMTPAEAITAPHGTIIWTRIEAGAAHWLGHSDAPLRPDEPPLPVTDRSWLAPVGTGSFSGFLTPTALRRGFLWPALDAMHGKALAIQRADRAALLTQADARAAASAALDEAGFGAALGLVGRVLDGAPATAVAGAPHPDPEITAAVLVAAAGGAQLQPRATEAGPHGLREALARAQIRLREVTLTGRWWQGDPGPLLARLAATADAPERPVALLPAAAGRMRLYDPAGGSRPVDAALAARLLPVALAFQTPLPARAVHGGDLLRLILPGLRPELRRLSAMGALCGLLALLTPLATSHMFGTALPQGDAGTAVAIVAGLVLAALGAAVFEAVRGIALQRLQARVDGRLQGAVWDRVLRMPPQFFRDYSVGDLADRANSVNAMRELLTATATQALLGAVFSLFSLALLFVYSWKLALLALGLTLGFVCLSVLITLRQIPSKRRLLAAQGRAEGLVLQLLAGMAKLRNAGAERRAFARWAEFYGAQQRHNFHGRRWNAVLLTLAQVFPILASLVFYLVAAPGSGEALLEAADFAGFAAAFGQFSAAMVALAGTAGTLAMLGPLHDRLRPLLEAAPEVTTNAGPPGTLTGAIELRDVTFRYERGAPPVVDALSLTIRPGEFLALVGASGSGKSTLVRLLLGFERPEAGGITFDGRDQAAMDLAALRRQIGVVLQDGKLMSGSLADNIAAGAELSAEQIWAAARLAGMEADLKAMPMGMQTVVSEGSSTLSGGQRQRLLIARALARAPRILIFDEATSALDNRTQAIVNESLERLNVTRIVVAHRLSTIVNAHRILVLEGGRVVEAGTFEQLMARGERFAQMARRQML